MARLQDFSPEILKNRHRLSQQQINDLIGESELSVSVEEKMEAMARVGEFLAVADAFSFAGLKFISFKGPLLSYRLYRDATYRQYNDFDFLMDIPAAEKAIEILTQKGYLTPVYKMPEDECRKKILYRHNTELYFYHSDKNVSIEIHWNLFTGRFVTSDFMNKIMFANLSEMEFAGKKFTFFTPEFDLLYLVIHGGLHSFRRLKWLVDIKDFLGKISIDKAKFLQLANQLHAWRIIALCNEMLKVCFPGSELLPSSFKASKFLINFTIHQIEMEKDEDANSILEYLKGLRFGLCAFPGIRYKLSILQSALYATDLASNAKIPCIPLVYYLISPFYKLYRGFR